MAELPKNKKLILFDGVCNLCNASVNFIIKHDKKNMFLFTALQSEVGKQIINDFCIDTTKVDSIILYNPNTQKIYFKSTAALKIASHLRFPLNMLPVLFVIPRIIRDWGYDVIAKNRYKWFGKKDTCMLPTTDYLKKFLE